MQKNKKNRSSKSVQSIALKFLENKGEVEFGMLMDRLKPGLTSFVYRYLQDRDLSNEAVSQTFISIWEKIDQYNPEYNFSTWAYAIAKNEALGQLRIKNKNISHEKLSENHSRILKVHSPIGNLEHEVMMPKTEDIVQKLYDVSVNEINNLKEPYKTVMVEREVNRKQLKNIAEELGWNTSTVKTRLRKARKDIASCISKKYPELLEAYTETF